MELVNFPLTVPVEECVNEDCREVDGKIKIIPKSLIKLTSPLFLRYSYL